MRLSPVGDLFPAAGLTVPDTMVTHVGLLPAGYTLSEIIGSVNL